MDELREDELNGRICDVFLRELPTKPANEKDTEKAKSKR
jgi:hypothetical protein